MIVYHIVVRPVWRSDTMLLSRFLKRSVVADFLRQHKKPGVMLEIQAADVLDLEELYFDLEVEQLAGVSAKVVWTTTVISEGNPTAHMLEFSGNLAACFGAVCMWHKRPTEANALFFKARPVLSGTL